MSYLNPLKEDFKFGNDKESTSVKMIAHFWPIFGKHFLGGFEFHKLLKLK